eukprot:scaffold710_cov171-Amphora_coffeaeformis.AAC.1
MVAADEAEKLSTVDVERRFSCVFARSNISMPFCVYSLALGTLREASFDDVGFSTKLRCGFLQATPTIYYSWVQYG